MATIVVVDRDKTPLGAGEVNAGGTVQVDDGDTVIIDPTANDNITLESATASAVSFSVVISASNANSFEIAFLADLSPSIIIGNNVDVGAVSFNADLATSASLTAGNNVTLGGYVGSTTGVDTFSVGDDFTATSNVSTAGENDVLSFGVRATLQDISSGRGLDTVTLGSNASAQTVSTGNADDTLFVGNQSNIQTILTGQGGDEVAIGDDFVGNEVNTEAGNDTVWLGANATLNSLDGGIGGGDVLNTQTTGLSTSNFETENVVCFTRGTLIRTESGDVPIEDLQVGDLVVTLDHGLQPIRWIGSSKVKGAGHLAPIEITSDLFGNARPLSVSPQHCILVRDWRASLYFGASEVLVPAKFLVNGGSIKIAECGEVECFHLLFDTHEIVFAEGAHCESFYPARYGIGTMHDAAR